MCGLADYDPEVPGAFAARAAAARTNCICHGTSYDFNDNLLPIAAAVWVRLVESRLGVRLWGEDELRTGLGLPRASPLVPGPPPAPASGDPAQAAGNGEARRVVSSPPV